MSIDTEDFNTNLCDEKLIGAKAFNVARVPTPRDIDGHDTHVALREAGLNVHDVDITIFVQARQGASRPWRGSPYMWCTSSDIITAVDTAVKDMESSLCP
jgi:hypothetical protein